MRRISPVFACATLLLASSPALANEHQIRVSEVLLSSGGDDAVQFVELLDFYAENFPNSYYLGVYDAGGASLGTVALPDPDPLTPGQILISTAAADDAFGTTGAAELTVPLPAAGHACFEVLPSTKISCLSWGCVDADVSGTGRFPSAEAAAPPDGMSAQLQGNGTTVAANFELAAPTPGEANDSGDSAPACPTDPDAGPSDVDSGPVSGDDGGVGGPDGGGNGGDGNGGGDDDSGCGCRTSSPGGAASMFLVLGIFLALSRTRRRSN
jgi:MYXO-CTERM domain-containing protein